MNISEIEAYGEFTITVEQTVTHTWSGTYADLPESVRAKIQVEADDHTDDADVTEVVYSIIDDNGSLAALVDDGNATVEDDSYSLEEVA